MTLQCCVCQKYKIANQWKKKYAPKDSVSHTYCPSCHAKAIKSMAKERQTTIMAK